MSEASNNSNTDSRRRRIRPFMFPTDQEADEIWNNILKKDIQAILNKDDSSVSFEEMYRTAYELVMIKFGKKMYLDTREVISNHLIETSKAQIIELSSVEFLTKLKSTWEDYSRATVMIRATLTYLDRVYVRDNKLMPLLDMSRSLFCEHIVRDQSIGERLISTLVQIIGNEQRDVTLERTVLKGIYQMLISLGTDSPSVYKNNLVIPLLEELTKFYQIYSQELLTKRCTFEYINEVSTLIDGILPWATECFDESTATRIAQALENELIQKHTDRIVTLVNVDVPRLLETNQSDGLEIIIKNAHRFPNSGSTISICVINYLHEQKAELAIKSNKEERDWDEIVELLFSLRNTISILLEITAKYDKVLEEQIQSEFQSIFDWNQNVTEHLSSTIKSHLEKGLQLLNDQEQFRLMKYLILMHYFDKNLFDEYYPSFKQQLLMMIPNQVQEKNVNVFVESLLQVKNIYDKFLTLLLNREKPLRRRLILDLESILNKNELVAEYLSIFIHDQLKRNGDDLSEQEVDIVLEKVAILLDSVQERDIFERYYQQHLAQRLLSNKAIVENTENQMLLRLKIRCSSTFIRQLEGMFKDMTVSNSTMTNFLQFTKQKGPNSTGIDLSVRVLTIVHWPIRCLNRLCQLPRIVNEAYQCFQSYYLNVHPDRRLTLQSNLGTSTLVATYPGGTENDFIRDESSSITTSTFIQQRNYILEVSTHQMVVLMLFNTRDSYSFEEILEQTNIDEKYLRRALLPLVTKNKTAKNILVKEPQNSSFQSNDQFSVNDSFSSKYHLVKFNPIREKLVSSSKQQETRSELEVDRAHQIDAAIVRIMKAQRTMGHEELTIEVIDQLRKRFPIEPQPIKKRIELLIESDYLSRSEEDSTRYKYVA